jgi:hypothetical protein
MLERREDGAGPARGRGREGDGGQLAQASARGHACRPPAVAVAGLRRSGRTGNGESPCGRIAPAKQPKPLSPYRFRCAAGALRTRRAAKPGALRAPLMLVKKFLTPRRASALRLGAPRRVLSDTLGVG